MEMCARVDPAHFDVDVSAVALSGTLTINGVPLPAVEPYGSVALHGPSGDVVTLGKLGIAGASAYGPTSVVAGSYDVFYSWDETDARTPPNSTDQTKIALPRNTGGLARAGAMLTSAQTLNIDLPAITLSGKFTLNGAVPPSATVSAQIELRNTTTHDKLVLGTVGLATQPAYITKQILPGTYDVYYVWKAGSPDALPRNVGALVRAGVALTTSQTFDVDVPTVTLSGNSTVNGATPAGAVAATIELRNPSTGDIVPIATAGIGHYGPVPILPGTYDVYYHLGAGTAPQPAGSEPVNGLARLRTGVAITATQALDIDVPSISLSGAITLNGAAPAGIGGQVQLVDPVTADRLSLGVLGNYGPLSIIPGTYEIHAGLSAVATTSGLRNVDALLGSKELTSAQQLNVDIPTVTVTVTPTLNGAAPGIPVGFSSLWLRSTAAGSDFFKLGDIAGTAAVSGPIVPGSYEVYYRYSNTTSTSPPAVPRNAAARVLAATPITASGPLAVDIPMITLTGAFTINGSANGTAGGAVTLRGSGAVPDSVVLSASVQGAFDPVVVVPGTYDVDYTLLTATPPSAMPINTNHKLSCAALTP